jgi:hypothetical protein
MTKEEEERLKKALEVYFNGNNPHSGGNNGSGLTRKITNNNLTQAFDILCDD